jgi:LEA14-like dessication related protein
MKLRGTIELVAVTGLLAGCAGIGDIFKEPEVRLDRVIVRGLSATGGTLGLMLGIHNPNAFDLRGTKLQVGFDVENSHVGDVSYGEDFVVNQNDTTTLTLPVAFQWAGVGSAGRAALTQGDIPYTMKGQVTLQTPWGPRAVSFTHGGRAPLTRLGGVLPIPGGR